MFHFLIRNTIVCRPCPMSWCLNECTVRSWAPPCAVRIHMAALRGSKFFVLGLSCKKLGPPYLAAVLCGPETQLEDDSILSSSMLAVAISYTWSIPNKNVWAELLLPKMFPSESQITSSAAFQRQRTFCEKSDTPKSRKNDWQPPESQVWWQTNIYWRAQTISPRPFLKWQSAFGWAKPKRFQKLTGSCWIEGCF